MRLWLGGISVLGILAGAVALPSTASHEPIRLSVADSRIELPNVEGNEGVSIRFTWSPTRSYYESVAICWNGVLDRSQLTSNQNDDQLCSDGANGTSGQGSADFEVNTAGRYEAAVRRRTYCEIDCDDPPPPPHVDASNVVTVDVVDPCRLRLQSFKTIGSHLPMLVGAPVACSMYVRGAESGFHVTGEDGSAIELKASHSSILQYDELPWIAALRLKAAGIRSDVSLSLGSRLSQFVTFASTRAGLVVAVSPARVTLTHRGGVTKVRVRRGRVVALGLGQYDMREADLARFCGRKRPTIGCLSKIRYRFFFMKRGRYLKAKVLGAGQAATFRGRVGIVKLVR